MIDAIDKEQVSAEIGCVISDEKEAFGLHRARKAGIPAFFINPKDFSSKEDFESAVENILLEHDIDFIALAGYMRIIGPYLITQYPNKILNVHPSLLPKFPGRQGVQDAFEAGAEETGATIHFINEKIDHGPIILQEGFEITPDDTLDTLKEKIHKIEYKLFPKAIDLFARGKIRLADNKVIID